MDPSSGVHVIQFAMTHPVVAPIAVTAAPKGPDTYAIVPAAEATAPHCCFEGLRLFFLFMIEPLQSKADREKQSTDTHGK